jgi:hypothetical protein
MTDHVKARDLLRVWLAEDRAQAPETNMYGCTPCPHCQSPYRWPTRQHTIVCDDCGLVEWMKP